MKLFIIVGLVVFASNIVLSQDNMISPIDKNIRKGRIYFYWGWNRSSYTDSNIKFTGDDYNFSLKNVTAKDRPNQFSLDDYFNPIRFTIPQYNFRVEFYFKENWDISFGIDHMKYVVQQNQTVNISGRIDIPNSLYKGVYLNQDIKLTEDFLTLEHTDGLNYINIGLRHSDKIISFSKIRVDLKEGLEAGLLIPKTNTMLLGKKRYDEFHLSGYGLNSMLGINISFFNKFFIQPELKGGFISMQNIRTTSSTADKASQNFFFSQFNIVFGGIINLNHRVKTLAIKKER